MLPSLGPRRVRERETLESLRGRPAFDFFPELCRRQPDILELRFATYRREPGLSKRLKASLTTRHEALRAAAERCSDDGVAFWDALMSVAMARNAIPETLADLAVVHDFNRSERNFVLSRDEVLGGGIQPLFAQLSEQEGLLVCSRLALSSGNTAFVPMLDFTCPCSESNAAAIRRMVKLAGVPEGILVGSGNSYHFYGVDLLSAEEWIRFMAMALLFAPITDSRYVAHRLADGECRLKIVDSRKHLIPLIEDVFCGDGS